MCSRCKERQILLTPTHNEAAAERVLLALEFTVSQCCQVHFHGRLLGYRVVTGPQLAFDITDCETTQPFIRERGKRGQV